MPNLDNKEAIIKSQGGENVIKSVNFLKDQLSQSFSEALAITYPSQHKNAKRIVICGMGGSRFPSLIISKLFKDKFKIPYEIVDDYLLPGYVDNETLVILSSYSGTTEEVLLCAKNALNKNAIITGITTGGELADLFKNKKLPFYLFNPIYNPSNQPRIGFGYMVGGHLGLLINLGYVNEEKDLINKSIEKLKQLTSSYLVDIQTSENPVKKLALEIINRYPYYVVSEFLIGVGNAMANQTNETAKTISSFRVIPELNHHMMEGLKHPSELSKIAVFVFFFSDLYSERIKKRFLITKDVVEQNKIKTIWYQLKGSNKIEQVFELMAFGSYLSMYLAAVRVEDPTVIPYVDYFKNKLKE